MLLTHPRKSKLSALVATCSLLAWVAVGCSSDEAGSAPAGDEITNLEGEAPLSDLDDLMSGAPNKADLPEEGKADATYPKQYFDLTATQSAVKSQGGRGVCSIFATAALMEHLYIAEGSMPNPDFSEQFLQWSVKAEVKQFTDTEGSSARYNLEAISRFGIVEESAWPYQSSKWSSGNDPACNGTDPMPVICYTNGNPPSSAMSAKRWYLPTGRWINSSARSIKAHMFTKHQAVVVGGTFFYQAWNHRASSLPTNNEYWRQGYVLSPNDKDNEESLKKRAGHAFVLVGWDDDLEVQRLDGEGKPMVDAEGKPLMEKGFFLFKNSWGTGSFGVQNPRGDGYGFIAMSYVDEHLGAYVSDLPVVQLPKEICNDGVDNDKDQTIDCDDSDCASEPACMGSGNGYTNATSQDIPDNNPDGIRSSIVVPDAGTISALAVTVDITHPYSGDLVVKLVRDGGGEVVLQNKVGGSKDDIKTTFSVSEFNGEDAAGTWTLVVADTSKLDVGKLNSWSMEVTNCVGSGCTSNTGVYDNTTSASIPDDSSAGVSSDIQVPDAGSITSMKVRVDITHANQIDLTIKLQRISPAGPEVILQEAGSIDGPFDPRSFVVTKHLGSDAKGLWRLVVSDVAQGDTGSLNSWSLEITR